MDFKELNDTDLVSLVNAELDEATSYFDTTLAKEREENQAFYDAKLPLQKQRGRSKYVSSDVFDVTESVKASLLETFSGNRTIVEFKPSGAEDVRGAQIATEYTNYVFYRQNDGYRILQDVISDGLISRIGVIKAYWKEDFRYDTYEFTNLTYPALLELEQDESVTRIEVEENDLGELIFYSGTYTVRTDVSHVAVEALSPEEFLISEGAKTLQDARIVSHRVRKSISGLIKEGYSKEKATEAYEASIEGKDKPTTSIDSILDTGNTDSQQKQTEEFWVYESYIEVDVEGEGKAKLFKVLTSGHVLVDKEEVADKPFFMFAPLARPHSAVGDDFVKNLKPLQNAKTTLTRSVLDHTVITNNPRMQVVKGTLHNPRELLDNRHGGIVNVTRPDGLFPIPQAPMNPYVFNSIQLLDDSKEQATGVSRLSQGINKDAVSKQNSSDMINGLVNLSQQRQKTIARNLAELCLKPLFLYIYKLVLENEDKQSVIEVAGDYVDVSPSEWVERKDVTVQFTIGYQEADREANELRAVYQEMAADPVLAQGFGYDKRFALYQKILEKKGIKDIQNYLTAPQQLQAPQPSPQQQVEFQLQQQAIDINERQTVNMEKKLAIEEYKLMRSMELDETRVESDILVKADKARLDEDKFQHSVDMDMFEKSIVAKKAAMGDITASANVTTGGA